MSHLGKEPSVAVHLRVEQPCFRAWCNKALLPPDLCHTFLHSRGVTQHTGSLHSLGRGCRARAA